MKNSFKKLMREQVQERLDQLAPLTNQQPPKGGWIATISDHRGRQESFWDGAIAPSVLSSSSKEMRYDGAIGLF